MREESNRRTGNKACSEVHSDANRNRIAVEMRRISIVVSVPCPSNHATGPKQEFDDRNTLDAEECCDANDNGESCYERACPNCEFEGTFHGRLTDGA